MLKISSLILIFAALALKAENALIYHQKFDGSLTAAISNGAPEMHGVVPPEFRDGVSGQSLLIGGKAGKQQRTYESSAQNIFDFKKGTVSLWVKPIDWNGLPTRYFHMIFRAVSAGKSNTQMLIYKYFNSENLLFLLGPMANSHFTTLNNPVRHWQPGQWHHLAAVWNGSDLAFYLDGQLYGTQKMRFPVSGNVPCASIALGPKGWDNTDGETLVDELKIFSRPLAPPEITALYKEHAAAVSNHDNFITLRNRPGKDRYTFSCCGLRDRNGAFTEPDTQWRIGSDGKNLFVKINTRKPCEILLYSDGVLSRHAMPGENECVIPLQGRDLRFNVVCGENNLAPVSGFPEDAANFYYLRFADDVPVVSIRKLYAGDVFEMEPEVISSPNGKNVQCTWISDNRKPYGMTVRNCRLFAAGRPLTVPKYALRENSSLNELYYLLEFLTQEGNQAVPFFRTRWRKDNRVSAKVLNIHTRIREKMLRIVTEIAKPGRMEVILSDNGREALTKTFAFDALTKYPEFEIDISSLKPANYLLTARFTDLDGKTTGMKHEQEYQIPGADSNVLKPYLSRVKGVPAPWTPLQCSGAVGKVWGREFNFSRGFLASSFISQGRELLSEPVYFSADGKKLMPAAAPEIHLISADEMKGIWEKKADLGLFKTVSRITLHFDGYCEVATRLDGPFDLTHLTLHFPLKPEYAVLVRDNHIVSLPPHRGKTGAVGAHWTNILDGGRSYFFWVGNESVGLNWMAETLADWHCRNEHRIEIRNGDTMLHLSNYRWVVPEGKSHLFKFAFTLTPSRPYCMLPRKLRMNREIQTWIQPWEHFNYPDQNRMDRNNIRNAMSGYKEGFLYFSRSFIGPFAPEWGYWEEQWKKPDSPLGARVGKDSISVKLRNAGNYATVRPNPVYHNFWLNQFSKFVDAMPVAPGVRHYYFDYVIDSDQDSGGRRIVCLESTRRLGLEIFAMTRAKDPDSRIMYHTSFQRCMPVQHFADCFLEGEGPEPKIATQLGYFDYFTPDYFRASFLTETWGLPVVLIPQMKRSLLLFRPDMAAKFDPQNPVFKKGIMHFYGLSVVHDVGIQYLKTFDPIVSRLIQAQDELGWDDEVKFHPYWKDSGVKCLSAHPDRIVASAYTRTGRLMLAVLNDTPGTEQVTVRLDLKKLGVKEGLSGHDAFEAGKKWILSPEWSDLVPSRAFRLVVFR